MIHCATVEKIEKSVSPTFFSPHCKRVYHKNIPLRQEGLFFLIQPALSLEYPFEHILFYKNGKQSGLDEKYPCQKWHHPRKNAEEMRKGKGQKVLP
jgi:hypothetical protein